MIVRYSKVTTSTLTGIQEIRFFAVYAIFIAKSIEFLIYDESAPSQPIFVEASNLDIVDHRISRFWVYEGPLKSGPKVASRHPMMGFKEIVSDRGFYQNLVEGDRLARSRWNKAKKKLDREFAVPDLVHQAEALPDNWLMCFQCADSWQDKEITLEVVECPNCSLCQRRPSAEE